MKKTNSAGLCCSLFSSPRSSSSLLSDIFIISGSRNRLLFLFLVIILCVCLCCGCLCPLCFVLSGLKTLCSGLRRPAGGDAALWQIDGKCDHKPSEWGILLLNENHQGGAHAQSSPPLQYETSFNRFLWAGGANKQKAAVQNPD